MKNSKKYILILLGILMATTANVFAAAWVEPTVSPPGGNTPAPLNVSGSTQTKTGALKVGSLGFSASGATARVENGGNGALKINSGISGTSQLILSDSSSERGRIFAGSSYTSIKKSATDIFKVFTTGNSRVGAIEYCDLAGSDCKKIKDIIDAEYLTKVFEDSCDYGDTECSNAADAVLWDNGGMYVFPKNNKNVGAREYCDINGQNCKSVVDLATETYVNQYVDNNVNKYIGNYCNLYPSSTICKPESNLWDNNYSYLSPKSSKKIGATAYCDSNGQNCKTISQLTENVDLTNYCHIDSSGTAVSCPTNGGTGFWNSAGYGIRYSQKIGTSAYCDLGGSYCMSLGYNTSVPYNFKANGSIYADQFCDYQGNCFSAKTIDTLVTGDSVTTTTTSTDGLWEEDGDYLKVKDNNKLGIAIRDSKIKVMESGDFSGSNFTKHIDEYNERFNTTLDNSVIGLYEGGLSEGLTVSKVYVKKNLIVEQASTFTNGLTVLGGDEYGLGVASGVAAKHMSIWGNGVVIWDNAETNNCIDDEGNFTLANGGDVWDNIQNNLPIGGCLKLDGLGTSDGYKTDYDKVMLQVQGAIGASGSIGTTRSLIAGGRLITNGDAEIRSGLSVSANTNGSQANRTAKGNPGKGIIVWQGDVDVKSGSVKAKAFEYVSDKKFKKDISTTTGLETITKLRGVDFTWKDSNKKDIGLIAQEVEKVLPELVTTSEDGDKAVKYGNLVAPLIEAVKEQQKQIEDLQAKVEKLEKTQK